MPTSKSPKALPREYIRAVYGLQAQPRGFNAGVHWAHLPYRKPRGDKPGQRAADGVGRITLFAARLTSAPRATSPHYAGWIDRDTGEPHGRSGDKLARLALRRRVGIQPVR